VPKPPVAYRLRAPDEVVSLIRGLHPSLKSKVKAGLSEIVANPQAGKLLRDELTGLRSYRIARFRIVYRIGENRVVELVAVGPRKTIYEETYRALRRGARGGSGPFRK